jgi:putative hemolysin
MLTDLLILFALIMGYGLLSAAEMAIVASRRGRLRPQADDGDAVARAAVDLAANPDRFLPAVRIGATLIVSLAAALGSRWIVPRLAVGIASLWPAAEGLAATIAFWLFVIALGFAVLVLGELVPKRLALRHPEAFARVGLPLLGVLRRVTAPLVWAANGTASAILLLAGERRGEEPTVSVDEIEELLEAGRAEGVLEAVEQAVAAEALRLGERTVRDIMRPRIDVDALDIDTPPSEVLGAVAMAGYSRLPVYEGSLDRILGYVSIKDVLRTSWMGWPIELRKLMHRAVFVPETMPLDRLLELFQKERAQFAIVLDEYGGTDGLVTLDDILAELVGEIHDEHRGADPQEFIERDDGSWLVEGSASIEDLAERFGIPLEDGPRDYATVSGLVLAELERMPATGDRMEWEGLAFEVVDMDGRRIDKLLVRRR